MSELIQKQKWLTLQDISPTWYAIVNKLLDGGKMTQTERTDLKNAVLCFVGEAHKGHTNEPLYGCYPCYKFSIEFFSPYDIKNQTINSIRDRTYVKHWEKMIPKFEQHWNHSHV